MFIKIMEIAVYFVWLIWMIFQYDIMFECAVMISLVYLIIKNSYEEESKVGK